VLGASLSPGRMARLHIAQHARVRAKLGTLVADIFVAAAGISEFATVCEGLKDALGGVRDGPETSWDLVHRMPHVAVRPAKSAVRTRIAPGVWADR
jgi:hypothetical protein